MEENIKKNDKLMIFMFASLALSLVSSITYMIYTIIINKGFNHYLFSIISVVILVIFSGILIFTGFFIENKKAKIFISIAALILSFYSIFQVIYDVVRPKDYVLDFTNYDIKEVVDWANKRDIIIKQEFEYSDTIKEYHVIKQNVDKGTPVKKVKEIVLTVSNGVDPTKTATVTNMIGWKLDDVIKFIDKNHLTNVTIKFEFSNTVDRDIIISQDVFKEIKRNEPITLVSSLGKESSFPNSISLDNIVGLDTFHALVYLGRNNLKYSIVYEYSEKDEGTVLKQSIKKWTNVKTNLDEIIITIAKASEVTVPDLTKMTQTEITEWAANNRIKTNFYESYDDTIKEGKVISANYSKGNNIKVGTTIDVTISKGSIKMIEFISLESFDKWANEKGIKYSVIYEYSDSVEQGKLIRASHSKGDIIKNNDHITITLSDGSDTVIPNLIGLSKDNALSECKKANITCKFEYLDNNNSYNIVTKQSMFGGSKVPSKTSITVTLGK